MASRINIANRQKWPGLPRGVKFDPSDEELLWHLLAKIGEGDEPHPYIGEFINSLDEDDEFDYSFPHKLPGVKQDGSFSYFFHRSFKAHDNKSRKRGKIVNDELGTIYWRKIGKTRPVYVDGVHKGSKKIMVLYISIADGEKPEKTNWVMHRYHVGAGEDAVGNLVISKIFCQQKFRQGDTYAQGFCIDTMQTVSMEGKSAVASKLIAPEHPAMDSNLIWMDVPNQDIHMDNYDTNDAWSLGKNDCDTANGEASPNVFDSSHSMLDTQELTENLCIPSAANSTCEISGQTGVDFHTLNMLEDATHVKVEPSDYMAEVSCNEIADSSPAVTGMSELSCEPEGDEIDNVTLQQRYKLMLSNMNHVIGCHIKLEHSKDVEQCARGLSSYNREDGKDGEVFHMKGRGHLDTNSENISAPQELSFSSNNNSIEECFRGKVKDEIQPTDEQILLRVCELHTAQHVDARFMDNPLMKSSDHVVSGSKLAVGLSLPSPNCLNNLLLEACQSDVSQDSGSVLLSEASAPEVRLPLISRKTGHVNGKSQSDSSVTLAEQLKSEPVEENMVSNFSRSSFAVQCCTDTLCCPVTEVETCSLPVHCHPEDTSVDGHSSGRCKSQHIREGDCRYCGESLHDSVQGLLHENDNDHPSYSIPSLLPLEVKVEPLEEIDVKCTLETNAEELTSPVPKAILNSNKKLPDSVLSSCSIRPKLESVDSGRLIPSEDPSSILPTTDIQRPIMKVECIDKLTTDFLDHISLRERMQKLTSISAINLGFDRNVDNAQKTLPSADSCSSNAVNAKTKPFSHSRKRKKTATDSVETALEEDAPGLLQVLLDKGITVEEIKLYGNAEDEGALPSSKDSFEELEAVITKLFSEGPSIFKFPSVRQIKWSKAVYCLACLISLIEQTRYLCFRKSPVEWGWCRDLQSFIFVFERHNRIVLERPEYGYATYFFELVESLPIDWQIRRLVIAMKLPCCSRTVILENKPLLVGEDLTEGEACVMEEYGWTRNTGLGTMLNYCDRVVHDRKNERYSSEWSGKIGKLLKKGHDSGSTVLTELPKKATQFVERQNPMVKLET